MEAIPATQTGTEDPSLAGVTYAWTASAGGSLSSSSGRTVTFTAGTSAASVTVGVTATQGGVQKTDSTTVTVVAPPSPPAPTPVPENPPEPTPVLPTPVAGVDQTLVTPAEGGTVETEDGSVSVDVPAGAIADTYMGVQIVPVDPVVVDVPPPPLAFKLGSTVVDIVFTDDQGVVQENVVLDRPVQVCIAYSDADAAAAEGGVFGLEMLRYADPPGQWVALSTTVDPVNKKLCAYTTRFSKFAVGITQAPAPPVEEAVLPATGDYAPSTGLVLSLIGVGVAFAGFGLLALRRRRMNT